MTRNTKILAVSVFGLAIVAAIYIARPASSTAETAMQTVGPAIEGIPHAATDDKAEPSNASSPSRVATIASTPGKAQLSPAYLPAEQLVLGNDGINVDALDHQFEGSRFEEFICRFEKDSISDSLASQLTSSTRSQIEQHIHGESQHLDRLACGLTLCVGSIRATTDAATDWWQKIGDGKDVRVYVFYDVNLPLGGKQTEQRFVFSIDPSVKSMFGSAKPIKH